MLHKIFSSLLIVGICSARYVFYYTIPVDLQRAEQIEVLIKNESKGTYDVTPSLKFLNNSFLNPLNIPQFQLKGSISNLGPLFFGAEDQQATQVDYNIKE